MPNPFFSKQLNKEILEEYYQMRLDYQMDMTREEKREASIIIDFTILKIKERMMIS